MQQAGFVASSGPVPHAHVPNVETCRVGAAGVALQHETLVTGSFVQNGYVLWHPDRMEAVVIDPGAEPERWVEWLETRGLTVAAILATHCHLDHVGAVAALEEHHDAPFYIHSDEQDMLDHLDMQCDLFGHPRLENPRETRHLGDGDVLEFGGVRLEAIATPGHTPGGTSFLVPALGRVYTGDTLFAGSIGRTDLPGGAHAQLIRSLQRLCLRVPDETVVCPGHGPETSIGIERTSNPFFRVER